MGHETEFRGELKISPPLIEQHRKFLEEFTKARHEGGDDISGDLNSIWHSLPSIWCPWELGDCPPWLEGVDCLRIPKEGKHYAYIPWLQYLLNEFLIPNGYEVNGFVQWRGENYYDVGVIHLQANELRWHCIDVEVHFDSRAFC